MGRDRIKFKVDTSGRLQIEKKLGDMTANLKDQGAKDAVLAAAQVFAIGIQKRMPRATGASAASVSYGIVDSEPGKTVAAAGPSKEHWPIRFKEFGFTDPAGIKHAAQPFMKPTADEDRDEALNAAGKAMNSHVK